MPRFLLAFAVLAAAPAEEGAYGVIVAPLRSASESQRNQFTKSLIESRHEITAGLVKAVKDDTRHERRTDYVSEPKHIALLLLAEFPDAKAVPVLLDNLGYQRILNPIVITPTHVACNYPAVLALLRVGLPAMKPVIEKLAGYDKDCQEKRNCVYIIQEHYGPTLARERIKQAIKEERDTQRRKNLEEAIKLIYPAEGY